MSPYVKFILSTDVPEVIIALLSEYYPFEGFEEMDGEVEAWIAEAAVTPLMLTEIEIAMGDMISGLRVEKVEPVNWNSQWEASFQPVRVGNFCCVRASFHEVDTSVAYDIVIDPKMSFGTGHHATTYMMIETMAGLEFNNRSVLDLGCGTGVLAILAGRMGASPVVAVDNDPVCVENTKENRDINSVNLEVIEGSIASVAEEDFDIILANINRNALVELLPQIANCLAPGGVLLISGILLDDVNTMKAKAQACGLQLVSSTEREEWACLKFIPAKPND